MAGNFRERALASAERQLENNVLLMARHFDQQLEDFMGIQRDVVAQIERSGAASPEAFRAMMSTAEWHDMLKLRLRAYTDVAGVNIFDANGLLINSSESWPVPDIRVGDRNYFKTLKSGSEFERFRIELVPGRFKGGWATVIACKVSGPNGQFLAHRDAGDHAGQFREFLCLRGACARFLDLDAPSRRHPARPLSTRRRAMSGGISGPGLRNSRRFSS